MNGVLNDLRFGLRQLAARPGFAAAAILTLALGIGVNTAVFSVLNGFLLKPLPYPGSSRLIDIHVSADKWHRDNIGMSKPLYMISQKWLKATSGTALYKPIAVDFQAQGRAVRLAGIEATASLFHVLRVQPLLGHVFVASNQEPGQDQVVVLSYQLWQQSFGGNPNVVGQTV
ncbi:MAG TPA: ABC transporter permease, partial [Gammaproteobacteria bacterium]|nr:ABC transporter permease [Gammaproteobacteria bacterium]